MEELKPYLASLTQYMVNSGMELAPLPKVIFKNDETNAEDVLARTAHYDPNNNSITLFISKRHPKDILRSYAHEMIHHNQNLENRLNNITTTNINEDDYLKEIEREAYEKGNMIFRGWENNYKQNIKENKMTVKELRKLIREAIYNELEVKNEDPSTLKPAIVFDSNKKQHFISLVNKSGKVNSLGPLISEDDIKKVNAGNTNDFCKKANQLYSNLDENTILENTNLKVIKIVDSCKLDENKINLRESLRKIIKEELQNTSLINEDLDTDIANVNKQIETLITQMAPLQKKKADLEKKKADLTKKKADQDLAASKITTESTANATGTGATMTAGTGEQYTTKFAFKKKKKTKLNKNR